SLLSSPPPPPQPNTPSLHDALPIYGFELIDYRVVQAFLVEDPKVRQVFVLRTSYEATEHSFRVANRSSPRVRLVKHRILADRKASRARDGFALHTCRYASGKGITCHFSVQLWSVRMCSSIRQW